MKWKIIVYSWWLKDHNKSWRLNKFKIIYIERKEKLIASIENNSTNICYAKKDKLYYDILN